MRVFTKGFILGLLLTIGWSTSDSLFSSRMYLGEARIHTIQSGEQLSHLAQQYYGDAVYWRELALINRAPNANNIYPGEKILLPSVNAIDKLANARRLSEVNNIVGLEEAVAVQETSSEAREFTTKTQTSEQPVAHEQVAPTNDETDSETSTEPVLQDDGLANKEIPGETEPLLEEAPVQSTNENDAMPATDISPEQENGYLPQDPANDDQESAFGGWWLLLLLGIGIIGLAYGLVAYRRNNKQHEKKYFEITPLQPSKEEDEKKPFGNTPKSEPVKPNSQPASVDFRNRPASTRTSVAIKNNKKEPAEVSQD